MTVETITPSDTYVGEFRDAVVVNVAEKTAVSVRDGVIEYLGIELNKEPLDRIFTVYRSPSTIANAAMKMRGIPITEDHVSIDMPAPTEGGFVSDAEMIPANDIGVSSTIAIRNRLALSDATMGAYSAGKRELSLSYHAKLIPHDLYDYEQLDIKPHHLAVLAKGRCGPTCSFLDKKPEDNLMDPKSKLHKAFNDADGMMNLQQIVELATALPEAIKSVPVDQLQELLPALQQIVEAAKGVMPEEEKPAPAEGDAEDAEPGMPIEDVAPAADDKEKDKPSFSDADMQAFADKANKTHAAAIEKARGFLAEDYQFADKNTADIMRDALATVETDAFADSELALAFKLLKRPASSLANFADAEADTNFTNLKDKEL